MFLCDGVDGGKRLVNDDISPLRVINRCLTPIAIVMSLIQQRETCKEAEVNTQYAVEVLTF